MNYWGINSTDSTTTVNIKNRKYIILVPVLFLLLLTVVIVQSNNYHFADEAATTANMVKVQQVTESTSGHAAINGSEKGASTITLAGFTLFLMVSVVWLWNRVGRQKMVDHSNTDNEKNSTSYSFKAANRNTILESSILIKRNGHYWLLMEHQDGYSTVYPCSTDGTVGYMLPRRKNRKEQAKMYARDIDANLIGINVPLN